MFDEIRMFLGLINENVILLGFGKIHSLHHDQNKEKAANWLNDDTAERLHDFEKATKLTEHT